MIVLSEMEKAKVLALCTSCAALEHLINVAATSRNPEAIEVASDSAAQLSKFAQEVHLIVLRSTS